MEILKAPFLAFLLSLTMKYVKYFIYGKQNNLIPFLWFGFHSCNLKTHLSMILSSSKKSKLPGSKNALQTVELLHKPFWELTLSRSLTHIGQWDSKQVSPNQIRKISKKISKKIRKDIIEWLWEAGTSTVRII